MDKPNIPYEEKKFMLEFLDIWSKYGKPPIKIYTNHLDSYDNGNGKIDGLPQSFLLEVLDLASECQTPARLECMGIKGSYKNPYTYMMEAGKEEEESDEDMDEEDTVTDYSEEDDDDTDETVTDYDVEDDGEEVSDDAEEELTDDENNNEGDDTTNEDTGNKEEIEDPDAITDYSEEDGQEPESEEGETDETTDGETLDDASAEDGEGETSGDDSDEVTDYDSESGGEEGGMMSDDTSTDETSSDDSSTEEESNSSDNNILVKNFSLMNDFEKIYALIVDNISMVNATLKSEPGQNRVLVQISKNLSNIKDFVLTFIQFHFKSDNYQFNLYYYEVVVQLLKLNLSMLEKSLNLRKN